ncbi:MAG: alpha-amylase family glycosyl hydrolase, partial [Planctomycetaceae bacterium]|nr:alpha-amylase family glycosyl hydrolase [Planctomycetaceae bacterium]
DQYEATLREIFPTVRRGNFSWHDGMSKWVWTTFNNYQWDLNYSNPAVFRAMLEELLFIAATGVDVVRLDAIAFVWKRMGTSCENLPEAHTLVQAFNRLCRVAAPGLIFKSEAIVHPDEVVKYVSEQECQLSYNPTLMALLWESLATRKTELLEQSLSHRHTLPPQTTWVNYLRCHDDIGWTFDDEDAAQLGINAFDHRQFLNAFYTGRFPGSFARGIPFQENEETGDVRIAGTLASLAGLELAEDHNDTIHQKLALRRIELLQAVMFSAGGIPLLYLGEEWGLLNDYEFVKDPAKASDARWVHRPKMNWDFPERLEGGGQADGDDWRVQIFRRLQHLIRLRKSLPALRAQDLHLLNSCNPHVVAFAKIADAHRLAVVGNFSEQEQQMDSQPIRAAIRRQPLADVITGRRLETSDQLTLSPYEVLWVHSPR